MNQEDHVTVIGRDGFYVFLKEVQGTATLRVGGSNPDKPRQTHPSHSDRQGSFSGKNKIDSSAWPKPDTFPLGSCFGADEVRAFDL